MKKTNTSDRSSGASDGVLIAFSRLTVFFGEELYLDRAGALYARPPGKGLHGAVEFNKAPTPAANLGWCHWFSFIKAMYARLPSVCVCGSHVGDLELPAFGH